MSSPTSSRADRLRRIATMGPEPGVDPDWWETHHARPARDELARLEGRAPEGTSPLFPPLPPPTPAQRRQMEQEERELARAYRKMISMERMVAGGGATTAFRTWLANQPKYARLVALLDTESGRRAVERLAAEAEPRGDLAGWLDARGLSYESMPDGSLETPLSLPGGNDPWASRVGARAVFMPTRTGWMAFAGDRQFNVATPGDLDALLTLAGVQVTPGPVALDKKYKISAGLAVVKPSGKLLVVHPTNASWAGSYGIPKGQVEPGDTSWFSRALNEVQEETGLDLGPYADESTLRRTLDHKDKHGKTQKKVVYWVVQVPEDFAPNVLPKTQLQIEEVDWAGFLTPDEVRGKMVKYQLPVLEHVVPSERPADLPPLASPIPEDVTDRRAWDEAAYDWYAGPNAQKVDEFLRAFPDLPKNILGNVTTRIYSEHRGSPTSWWAETFATDVSDGRGGTYPREAHDLVELRQLAASPPGQVPDQDAVAAWVLDYVRFRSDASRSVRPGGGGRRQRTVPPAEAHDWYAPGVGRTTLETNVYQGPILGHRVTVGNNQRYFWSHQSGWDRKPPLRLLTDLQDRGHGPHFKLATRVERGITPNWEPSVAGLLGPVQAALDGLVDTLPAWLEPHGFAVEFEGVRKHRDGVVARWSGPRGAWEVTLIPATDHVRGRGKYLPVVGAPVVGPEVADPEAGTVFDDEWMFEVGRRTQGRRTGGGKPRMERMAVCPPSESTITVEGYPRDNAKFQRASVARSVSTNSKTWGTIGKRAERILAKHGMRLGRQLGCGQFACAYNVHGDDQFVAKITGDPSDAAAWRKVMAALGFESWDETSWDEAWPKLALAQVRCVEAFPIPVPVEQVELVRTTGKVTAGGTEETTETLIDTIKSRRMFLLLQERMEPLSPREEKFFNDEDIFRSALKAGAGSGHYRARMLGLAVTAGIHWPAVEAVVETMRWLRKQGIIWHDLHGGNLMAVGRGARRRYKIVDLGYSEAPKARIAVMEAMKAPGQRVSIMESCPYSPGKPVADYMAAEHAEAEELLAGVIEAAEAESKARARDPGKARERFEQFAIDLEQHFLSEERDIFPVAVKLGKPFAAVVPKFIEQHKPIRALLAEQRARHPRPCLLALARLRELLVEHKAAEDALDWSRVVVPKRRLVTETMPAHRDRLPGGRADTRLPFEFEPDALARGIEIESEHTDDPTLAREIAMDHLAEYPNYYDPEVGLPSLERRLGGNVAK